MQEKGKEKIIFPLDVQTAKEAIALVRLLKNEVGQFKIGFELICSMLRDIITPGGADEAYVNMQSTRELFKLARGRVFADVKLLDIVNTVKKASKSVTGWDISMFNLHCTGGIAMMKEAKEQSISEAIRLGLPEPKIIGVTLLTSINKQVMNDELGIPGEVIDAVVRFARNAQEAGLNGVVCSPHEIEAVRATCGSDFLIVTPGVRPAGADIGDQKRVMTPSEAIEKGADNLVIGRPIADDPDPVSAARAIAKEIYLAQTKRSDRLSAGQASSL